MTNKEIKELAGHREVPPWVMKLVADAVAMEREACAKVCDESHTNNLPAMIGMKIRARGEL